VRRRYVADDDDGRRRRDFDRVFVILMENHGFDEVISPLADPNAEGDPNAPLLTPFITNLAYTQGLATFYFGVTIPACRTISPRSPATSSACRTTTTAASPRR
jgi:hypothetical protein